MDNGMAGFFKWAGILAFATFSTVAFAVPCDPEKNAWVPSRYYPPGNTVFHNGNWYESRELHEGKTPGSAFEWKKLEVAPDCHHRERRAVTASEEHQQQPQDPGQTPQQPAEARRNAQHSCVEPGRWSFGASYTVGQMAVHEGRTYRAIRPSNGQMPGMSQPPHWQPIDRPCGNQADQDD